jgi:hypothetical protein
MSFEIVISRHVSPQLFQRKSWTPELIKLFDDKRRFVNADKKAIKFSCCANEKLCSRQILLRVHPSWGFIPDTSLDVCYQHKLDINIKSYIAS